MFVSLLKLETKLYIARLQSRAMFGLPQRFTDIEEAVGELEENGIVLYVDQLDSCPVSSNYLISCNSSEAQDAK